MARFDVGDLTLSTTEEGEVRCNIGDQATGTGFAAGAAMWGVDGFMSCPNQPTTGGNAECIYMTEGQQRRILCTRDRRNLTNAGGALSPGDRAIVSAGEAWFRLTNASDRIQIRTMGPAGEMMIDMNATTGTITLSVAGGAVGIDIKTTEVNITAPLFKVNGVIMQIP
jgi:hypothetical protein